jgi:hypothetical protein
MAKYYYDLHIHSCLSPCGDELMTLTNILNMAKLKELDIISVTDHNSAKNIEPLLLAAVDFDILVIPGIEVESYEGIHFLCYFRDLESIKQFDQIIYENLPNIKNNEKLLGKQILLNQIDEEVGYENRMLLHSTNLKMDTLIDLVHDFHGIIFASHIDKYANSIQTILGFIPNDLLIDGIEIKDKNYELPSKYIVIYNSDAHFIADICEKENYLDISEKTINDFFKYFSR